LERCIFWSTLKFQKCSSCYITGDDISRLLYWQPKIKETVDLNHLLKEITNATKVFKVTVVIMWFEVIGCKPTMICSHCYNNVPQQWPVSTGTIYSNNVLNSHCCNSALQWFHCSATMHSNNGLSSYCCNNVFQQWPQVMPVSKFLGKMWQTGRHGQAHKVFFTHTRSWRTPINVRDYATIIKWREKGTNQLS
jgi:hypothetical protein